MSRYTRRPVDAAIVDRIANQAGREISSVVRNASSAFVGLETQKAARGWALFYVGVGLSLLITGFAGGWFWQSGTVATLQNTMAGVQHMAYRDGPEDARQWLALMAYNHMHDVTGRDCRVVVVNSRRRCDTAIWLDPEPASSSKPN